MVYGNIGIRKNLETFQTSTQGIESQVLMEKGSSLYIGGSVTFAGYRKRHKLEIGNDILESELYLKTQKTKDQMWICGKSKRVWNTFTRNIKHKLGEGAEEEDVELN